MDFDNLILRFYLLGFACFFFWEIFLNFLQLRALSSDQSYPKKILDVFSSQVLHQSEQYSLAKLKFGLFSHIYSSLLLLLIIFSGVLISLHDYLAVLFSDSIYFLGVSYILLISFVFQLIDWPLQLYGTFVVEERFGFNRMTLKQWVSDLVKGIFLGLLVMVPVICGLLAFVRAYPDSWWILAYVFIMLFQLTLLFVYPVWIAPIFNKFEKLPEGNLRERIFILSKHLNFQLSEVFLMDGSKRSAHGNAYFTGFGRNQRIVLFDTLIKDLSEDQIVAVLAQEIGHKKLSHVSKQILFQLGLMFIIFFGLGLLFNYLPFYQAFGFSTVNPEVGLVLFIFLISPFIYFLTPISSILQRRFEYQADKYAKKAIGSHLPLSEALIRLYEKNLGNLRPHPWYSFFHYSHPTLVERLDNLAG